MGLFKEFKAFAMRGNVIDMAVGIILGGAFGKIVSSLVGDVLMPAFGRLLGKVDFTNRFISLTGEQFESLAKAKEAGAATLNYGVFINTVIEFTIIAFAVFMMIKAMNRATGLLKKEEAPAAPTTKECPRCCSTIPLKATRCAHCTSDL